MQVQVQVVKTAAGKSQTVSWMKDKSGTVLAEAKKPEIEILQLRASVRDGGGQFALGADGASSSMLKCTSCAL